MLQDMVSSQATLRGICLKLIVNFQWNGIGGETLFGGGLSHGAVFLFSGFLEKSAEQTEVPDADSGVVEADCVEL